MTQTSNTFEQEVSAKQRYGFGKNWARFLELLDADRIAAAEGSLQSMLQLRTLDGRTFLDIGSGSGLFSLAARRLGAKVTSFDFDTDSVDCTQRLKDRYFKGDDRWTVLRGSVLDRSFLAAIPRHDVVYSWGVLHHTGRMFDAIANAQERVGSSGLLFIALYRKTWLCPAWRLEKRLYVASSPGVQQALRAAYSATLGLAYRATHAGAQPPRGMDFDTDVHDWLGGYPYESITPRKLKRVVTGRGFEIVRQVIKSEGMSFTPGCDEYLFRRRG